jgi:hypothetical protein
MESKPALIFCFDAFSSREPAPTPDQVRGHASLENALDRGLLNRDSLKRDEIGLNRHRALGL